MGREGNGSAALRAQGLSDAKTPTGPEIPPPLTARSAKHASLTLPKYSGAQNDAACIRNRNAVMKIFKILFGLEGRIGRLAFLAACAFAGAASMLGQSLLLLGFGLPETYSRLEDFQALQGAPAAMAGLFAIHSIGSWIGFAAGAKRLHDLGRPAGLQIVLLLALTFAVVAMGAALLFDTDAGVVAAGVLLVAVSLSALWIVVQLFFRRGDAGANRFGAPPSAPRLVAPATPGEPVASAARL